MTDLEGNMIEIQEKPNGHILCWGQSGQGKTYFFCRKIEECVSMCKTILILDYSGSYTQKEMEKNQFLFIDAISVCNLSSSDYVWKVKCDDNTDIEDIVFDVLCRVVSFPGFYQKKVLKEMLEQFCKEFSKWSMNKFVDFIESELEERKCQDLMDEKFRILEKIVEKLYIFHDLSHFQIRRMQKNEERMEQKILLLQLSFLPEQQRNFLMGFILTLLSNQMYKNVNIFQFVFLDEIQKLSLKSGSALEIILREGRKFGISLVMGTQFISHYEKLELATLLQAGTYVVFKPIPKDIGFSAKIISVRNNDEWEDILSNLDIGLAVLKGRFKILKYGKIINYPIVCKI